MNDADLAPANTSCPCPKFPAFPHFRFSWPEVEFGRVTEVMQMRGRFLKMDVSELTAVRWNALGRLVASAIWHRREDRINAIHLDSYAAIMFLNRAEIEQMISEYRRAAREIRAR